MKVRLQNAYYPTEESDAMTNLEIVERAMKFIHDPDWEFHESVVLLLASRLANDYASNKSEDGK